MVIYTICCKKPRRRMKNKVGDKSSWFNFIVTLLVVLLHNGFFVNSSNIDDQLCHPLCSCLDTNFDCRKRGLNDFPKDFPIWVQNLNISNNEISDIEEFRLSRLVNLQSLSLDGNNLTSIPNGGGLNDLTYLSLSRNMISTIDNLSSFKSLQELDVSKNRIEVLTNNSFINLTLLTLNIASNQIEFLESGSLDGLSFLADLNLSKNRLKLLPRELFSQLKNLEHLDLSRNKLELMDSLRFQELKKLQVLNLRRNHMSNLSDAAFFGLDNIQQLYLDGNNIKMVEKRWLYGLKSLRMLNLSRNDMNNIDDEVGMFCEELEILDLSWNKLTGINKNTFTALSKLRHLDLSSNQIIEIEDESFLPLEKLENLDLSNNELSWALEDIAGPFTGLVELQILNLASNKIRSLHPQVLDSLSNLHTLNLSSNPLTLLSEIPFQNVQFSGFHLILKDVTTLVCDCETEWLRNLYGHNGNNNRVTNSPRIRHREDRKSVKKNLLANSPMVNSPICAYPPQYKGKALSEIPPSNLICSDNALRPVFTQEPKTQVFLMDGNGTLSCSIKSSSNFPIRISWRKDHHELSKHMESFVKNMERTIENGILEVNSTLELGNVSSGVAGRYQCVSENSLGVVYSAKANVTVHIFPTFLKKPANLTVRLGKNAKLECAAKGLPTPEIAFQKDGGEDFPAALDRRFHVMPNDDSFFIMEVKLTDSGIYCCSAKNDAGEIKSCATVTVYETPSFVDLMEDETAVEGSNALLQCLATGAPQPTITWNRDGVAINENQGKKYHLTENSTLLIIKNVELSDAGRYECFLSNALGTARGFSNLNVLRSSSNLDTSAMTIIFIIIAVFCVVVTSVVVTSAWVVVIYRTRKRTKNVMLHNRFPSEGSPLRPFADLGGHSKFEDNLEEGIVSNFGGASTIGHQLSSSYHHKNAVQCGDVLSQSSCGKETSTGDDLTNEIEPLNGIYTDAEEEALMRNSRKKKNADSFSFSTFGGVQRASNSRLSASRFDFNKSDIGDVLVMSHNPGKEFGSTIRKVACPTIPSLQHQQQQQQRLQLSNDTLQVISSGTSSSSSSSESKSSSSSGYSSSVILPRSHLIRPGKERTQSVNSAEGIEILNNGLVSTSTDLTTAGEEDADIDEEISCPQPAYSTPALNLIQSKPDLNTKHNHNSNSISTQV